MSNSAQRCQEPFTVVIPVYKNADSLPLLLEELEGLARRLDDRLVVVFVVDGSPDTSYLVLREALPNWRVPSRLLTLSRNFGSFSAIRVGLEKAEGEHVGVMAADLQDSPDFMFDAFQALAADEADVVIGTRAARHDPLVTRMFSSTFWFIYRAVVEPSMPKGGADVFACNRKVRDTICQLTEVRTSLLGLLFWVGFRRIALPYVRRPRQHGRSAWGFRRKVQYLLDSIFAFTEFPIHLLTMAGALGVMISIFLGIAVLVSWLAGLIEVQGYTPIILSISFFGALNLFGLGVVGSYVWRTYENAKRRPYAIVRSDESFGSVR